MIPAAPVRIAGFVSSGFMAILALCMPILFAVADDEDIGLVGAFAIAFLYLLMAALYFYLSFLLLRYSRAIRDLVDRRAVGAMGVSGIGVMGGGGSTGSITG